MDPRGVTVWYHMTYYQVGDVETTPLVTISAGANLRAAMEAMFSNGQRQVGIVDGDELRGLVTHHSVTRAQLLLAQSDLADGVLERNVTLAMEDPDPTVDESEDVFTLFDVLAESPYVLIERDDGYHVLRDVGFHQYLRTELEVFILIEEIERALRNTFLDRYGDELSSALTETFEGKEVRTPASVHDCSFAHYQIFISANWDRFEDYFDEDREFVRELLDNAGDIRNALFHFRASDTQKVEEREYLMFVREYFDVETRTLDRE